MLVFVGLVKRMVVLDRLRLPKYVVRQYVLANVFSHLTLLRHLGRCDTVGSLVLLRRNGPLQHGAAKRPSLRLVAKHATRWAVMLLLKLLLLLHVDRLSERPLLLKLGEVDIVGSRLACHVLDWQAGARLLQGVHIHTSCTNALQSRRLEYVAEHGCASLRLRLRPLRPLPLWVHRLKHSELFVLNVLPGAKLLLRLERIVRCRSSGTLRLDRRLEVLQMPL